jgi:hypothetical protein
MHNGQPAMPDFFIDYHDADVQWARWIAYQLENAQYTVFYREQDIQPGMNRVLSIDDVLQGDVRIIPLLSPDYLQKDSVRAIPFGGSVWSVKFTEGRLLPIRVRTYLARGFLSTIEPIDLVGLGEVEARIKLLDSITTERKRPAASPNFPGSTARQRGTQRPRRYPGILPPIWNVPQRNSIFTDRDPTLANLYEIFKEGQEGQVLTHVINGLGGVGKTQVAIEYAYRYNHRYDAVFWIDVSDEQTFAKHLDIVAQLLTLQEKMTAKIANAYTITSLKLAVKQWLQALADDMRWLLILDNIEDFALIKDFIPSGGNGHVLMTVRAQAIGTIASSRHRLPEMSPVDGALLLLRRTGKFGSQVLPQDISHADLVTAQELSRLMGNLPLALDQAGAYIERVDIDVSDYLEYYNDSRWRPKLLEKRGEPTMHHPASVATTWNHAFTMIRTVNPDAYALLLLCSFLHHEAIPEEVLTRGVTTLPILQTLAHNPLLRDAAFAELRKYSLLVKENQTKTFSMHRLVQVVLRDSLSEVEQRQWAEFALIVVYSGLCAIEQNLFLLPSHPCPRYFFHVQSCLHAIKKWGIVSDESVFLLHLMGKHLHDYACNSHTRSTVGPSTAMIIETLEDSVAHLRVMKQVKKAEEINIFVDLVRANCASNA